MIIRVGLLLQKSVAVIYPLSIANTRGVDPEGEETTGYDDTLREPIVYDNDDEERTDARTEDAVIRIPCQVETLSEESLRQYADGDTPITNIAFVFHRQDLKKLSLLDSNGDVVLKKGDRISHLEKWGAPVGTRTKTYAKPLFFHEVRPGSWGFGPDGYDLEIGITTQRLSGIRT